ncbi:MAG: 50S ribosomal protein L6 [Candidatus Cloacimonetes bacterium]|nr:50S ribosomal protein L6 [Candidatus Cloacimonadota bacterium]
MSRIGKQPVNIPAGVTATIEGDHIMVKGKLGELAYSVMPGITVSMEDNQLRVQRLDDSRNQKALHGLTRVLLYNMVIGVSEGYQKELHIIGTGYSAEVVGVWLKLNLGFAHEIFLEIPERITVEAEAVPRNRQFIKDLVSIVRVSGASKEDVGKLAAEIRRCRPPINYNKGKGVRYKGEFVKIKPGKSSAAG